MCRYKVGGTKLKYSATLLLYFISKTAIIYIIDHQENSWPGILMREHDLYPYNSVQETPPGFETCKTVAKTENPTFRKKRL